MIVAGFGFSTRVGTDSLRDALARACQAAGVRPDALATAHDKAPALAPLADGLRLPLHPIAPDALTRQTTLTQSPRALHERGTGSVAEAAALSAAGPGARLLTPRIHAQDRLSSCALAEGPKT
ncbi:cobalamin biosynthesis protein [Tropicibacter sp. S64]|uniref:cobalamin biosynthesis protein n=1 Tax=Tropicibacter sp. S64 TaxID=3415122 RepID=UPI003C79815E